MKIKVLSDLHLEFHQDSGDEFIRSLPTNCDVVVIAGDLCSSRIVKKALRMLSHHFAKQKIIYVLGNHDLYHATRNGIDGAISQIKEFVKTLPNVYFLENDSVTINDQTFFGTTLWFEHSGQIERYDSHMNDFGMIDDMYKWIGIVEETAVRFLQYYASSDDVIITHHLPHENSIHQKYKGDALNKYFLSNNAQSVIYKQKPKLWIHGHTHESCDYIVDKTRVVCNPFGYVGYEPNPNFNNDLVIDV
jgi:predicted phosphodiesterase